MNRLFRRYIHLLILEVVVMTLSSCIYDSYDDGEETDDKIQLLLRIKAVGAAEPQQGQETVESLKSLRIIIIDSKGYLEANELIPLPLSEYTASTFSHLYMKGLNAGTKKVYLVANEESVGKVAITNMAGIPADIPMTTLTDMLEYFQPEEPVEDASGITTPEYVGTAFERALESIYFENDYSRMRSGKSIFLPYTSYYEIEVRENKLNKIEKPLYLVPVAAKFDFTFVNYRRLDSKIEDIIISKVNKTNFLNAQLNDEEKYLYLDGTKTWWIDWLQATASTSQTVEDNNAFNTERGWITSYRLPVETESPVEKSLNPNADRWVVTALKDKTNPSKIAVGPFYVPESRNLVQTKDSEGNPTDIYVQSYSLSFKIHDVTEDKVTFLQDYEIDTLKALFRATHVIITVELYESQVAIYAEIAPWEKRLFLGYVQQDDD